MNTNNYIHGSNVARVDRKHYEPARYRVHGGTYQFRDIHGAWHPTGSADLTERARGYLDTYHAEALYV